MDQRDTMMVRIISFQLSATRARLSCRNADDNVPRLEKKHRSENRYSVADNVPSVSPRTGVPALAGTPVLITVY